MAARWIGAKREPFNASSGRPAVDPSAIAEALAVDALEVDAAELDDLLEAEVGFEYAAREAVTMFVERTVYQTILAAPISAAPPPCTFTGRLKHTAERRAQLRLLSRKYLEVAGRCLARADAAAEQAHGTEPATGRAAAKLAFECSVRGRHASSHARTSAPVQQSPRRTATHHPTYPAPTHPALIPV